MDINRTQGIPISYKMLAGKGPYRNTDQQLNFNPAAYAQVNGVAVKAWRKLPSTGKRTEDLSKVRQDPDELFQDFVSRLLLTVGRLIRYGESGVVLVKQLAFENANSACQAAIRPFRKKGQTLRLYSVLCGHWAFLCPGGSPRRCLAGKVSEGSTVSTTERREAPRGRAS